MAGPFDDDPFTWDVERVVRELCTVDYTWNPTPRSQLPDPTHLAARLRAGGYDGELLLDSMDDAAELWADLGVTVKKHKMALRTAIRQFRTRSPRYHAYKKSLYNNVSDDMAVGDETQPLSFMLEAVTSPGAVSNMAIGRHLPQPSQSPAQNGTDKQMQVNYSSTSSEPSKKKRRLDPTQLTIIDEPPSRDSRFGVVPISTEADAIMGSMAVAQPSVPSAPPNELPNQGVNTSSVPDHFHASLLSPAGAYWGNGRFSFVDVIDFDATIDDGAQFGWGRPKLFGRARKRYVNGLMKRYLRDPDKFKSGGGDDASALPIFGESDDDENPEWQEIEQEIEEEEEEVRRERERELAKKSQLQPTQVDTLLAQMVQQYGSRWNETELPKRQSHAFSLWDKARRNGTRTSQVIKLTKSLHEADGRLARWLKDLKGNIYSNENDLRHIGPILEPTVWNIHELKWRISVLQMREPPEKTKSTSAPKIAPTRKRPSISDDDGIDIWGEDDLDDFIVDDPVSDSDHEDLVAASDDLAGDAMDVDDPAASDIPIAGTGQNFASTSDGDIPMHDLTGVGSSKALVNLCTPEKLNQNLQLRFSTNDDCPPISSLESIVEKGTEYWESRSQYKHLVITLISLWPQQRKAGVFNTILYSDNSEQIWDDLMRQFTQDSHVTPTKNSPGRSRRETGSHLARLFDIFTGTTISRISEQPRNADRTGLDKLAIERIKQKKGLFDNFYCFLKKIARYYGFVRDDNEVVSPCDQSPVKSTQGSDLTPGQRAKLVRQQKQAQSARIRREEQSSSKNIEARKLKFRQLLEDSALVPKEKSRLIINESKDDSKGLIFINNFIASRIQDHQIDGVRFMWDEITKKTKQGCLLAHSMGLGKTMQVITLLTAIAEAGKSEDESISSQIPEHLKDVKFLILCPAFLLNNWVEELYCWAPSGVLGNVYFFQASDPPWMRAKLIKTWAGAGGILVMSYTLLRGLEEHPDGEELHRLILDTPSLVVGDEAQNFKNRESKTGIVANQFKTTSRIALTGSPLANNVDEYYSMINWVSPGFLGEPSEFSATYAKPIEDGLWKSSNAAKRRRAKICLAALKKVVEPKVQRRTIAFLKDRIPPKKEYIIYLNLSPIQEIIYQVYLKGILGEIGGRKNLSVTSVWGLTAALRLLLSHPYILQKKLLEKETGKQLRKKKKGTPDDEMEDSLGDASENVRRLVLDALKGQQTSETIDASPKMLVLDAILEESMRLGENVLVFSQSLDVLDFVEEHLCAAKGRAYKRLDGKVPPPLRQGLVKEFNCGKSQAFLISTTAGGVGLNIHGATRIVILDFKYNPVHEQQAIGRAYRIGQTKKVVVYWLICSGTFEKTMHNQQVFKNQLASRVVDAKNPLSKADNSVTTWFRDYERLEARDKTAFRGQDPIMDTLLESDIVREIPWIETTDTFEEEELDKDLPADAQREADLMAHRQQTAAQNSGNATPSQISSQISSQIPSQIPSQSQMQYGQGPSDFLPGSYTGGQRAAMQPYDPRNYGTQAPAFLSLHDQIFSPQGMQSQAPIQSKPMEFVAPPLVQQQRLHVPGQGTQPTNFVPFPTSTQQSQSQPMFGSPWQPAAVALEQASPVTKPAAPPPVPFGTDGVGRGQQVIAAPPVRPLGEAARPITMGNTQERRAPQSQMYESLAKGQMETGVRACLTLEDFSRFEAIKVRLQAQMTKMGGMERHTVWTKLGELVQAYSSSLAGLEAAEPAKVVALLLKGKSEESMHAMLADLTREPNEPTKTRERDPDHVNKILGRIPNDGEGGSSASKQRAADLAAVHEIISRRQGRATTEEGEARQSPRGSTRPGGSISEPLIIDD